MNCYQNISNELRTYFSNHPIFKILLPLDMVFVFGGAGIMAVDLFIHLGDFLPAAAYYLLLLGILLAYANLHEEFMYIGFFGYAAVRVINVLSGILDKYYRHLDFSSLLAAAIFGGIGYLIFKRKLKSNAESR